MLIWFSQLTCDICWDFFAELFLIIIIFIRFTLSISFWGEQCKCYCIFNFDFCNSLLLLHTVNYYMLIFYPVTLLNSVFLEIAFFLYIPWDFWCNSHKECFFQTCMPFIFFPCLLHWLELAALWIRVVRAYIFALFLILEGKQSFAIKYSGICRFFVNALYQVQVPPFLFLSEFLSWIYMCWILSDAFLHQ